MQFHTMLNIPRGLSALIGGGGKSSLLRLLGKELAAEGRRVVLAATTHMHPPEGVPLLTGPDRGALETALAKSGVVCVGDRAENGKLTLTDTPMAMLLDTADYVIAEADGSRQLPLKAHAAHEPVIPPQTRRVILVIGIDGVHRPIQAAAHRPELYARLLQTEQAHIITPADVAAVINSEGYGDMALINKVETEEQRRDARRIAQALTMPAAEAAIRKGYLCLL